MQDRNKLNKIFYGSYLAMVTISTLLNYLEDSKKKLPLWAEIIITILDLIILPTFITAFIYKIKADKEVAAKAKADAVVPEIAADEAC